MKHKFLKFLTFRQKPNESLTQTPRLLGRGWGKASLFLLLLALSFGFSSQAWGGNDCVGNVPQDISDTSYIVTANLSTQDTIYVKHEDTTNAGSNWWRQNRDIIGGIIQALLALLAGAGVSWCTSKFNAKQERKKMEQERSYRRMDKIMDYGIEQELEIYQKVVIIQNAFNRERADVERLIDELKDLIIRYKPNMQDSTFQIANDIYAYFTIVMTGIARDTSAEKKLLDNYCKLYNQSNI